MENTEHYLQSHAKRELEILAKTTPDAIVLPFTELILALCHEFDKSGQSGGSAPYTANSISKVIYKLMMRETIAPLTGEDDEWDDLSDYYENKEKVFQNNRDSRVFKGENGRAYFLNAIVFDGNIGGRFTGGSVVEFNGKKIGSWHYIKQFPFQPKTFYIDVIEHRWKDKNETIPDENGDWWTHEIKNPKQLEEVFEYYDIMAD